MKDRMREATEAMFVGLIVLMFIAFLVMLIVHRIDKDMEELCRPCRSETKKECLLYWQDKKICEEVLK